MSSWRDSITQSVGADSVGDIASYVSEQSIDNTSPIDVFYKQSQSILAMSTTADLDSNEWLGALSAIAVVSCTENYFRQVFSRVLKICSESQKNAASNMINLGSVIWHPANEIERGAFEHISLASAENIIKTSKTYLGIDLKKKGPNDLSAIFSEFDKVCELRHGIVHSGRIMAGKNGIKLKLPATENITVINIKFAQLQEIVSVCTTMLVSVNQVLFEEMCRRWATSWRDSPSWQSSNANEKFKAIWSLFHSQIDFDNETIPLKCTWVKCRNLISTEFNI